MSIYVEDIFKNILLMVEAVKSVWRIWVVSLILAIRLVLVSEAPNIYVSWIDQTGGCQKGEGWRDEWKNKD